MKNDEVKILLNEFESDRIERKESLSDKGKICEAICAFANDLPCHQKPGYIFIGVKDDGTINNLTITDEMLRDISNIRSDGNIIPFPVMNVQKHTFDGKDVVIVKVFPSEAPPVRYYGRVWIRVGSRRAMATPEEERRLSEKRIFGNLPFDTQSVSGATVDDISTDLFQNKYLPYAIIVQIICNAVMHRTYEGTNAPVRFHWFSDRIEIQSPGGLYGQVTPETFA